MHMLINMAFSPPMSFMYGLCETAGTKVKMPTRVFFRAQMVRWFMVYGRSSAFESNSDPFCFFIVPR